MLISLVFSTLLVDVLVISMSLECNASRSLVLQSVPNPWEPAEQLGRRALLSKRQCFTSRHSLPLGRNRCETNFETKRKQYARPSVFSSDEIFAFERAKGYGERLRWCCTRVRSFQARVFVVLRLFVCNMILTRFAMRIVFVSYFMFRFLVLFALIMLIFFS